MATYLMLGKYTAEGVKGASAARTKKVMKLISAAGGRVNTIHALLGSHDLAMIVELPGNAKAVQMSFAISKATGIAWTTLPAVPVEEFDRLIR